MDPQRKNPAGEPSREVSKTPSVLRLVAQREQSLLSLMELSQELSVSLDFYGIADLAMFNLMGQLGTSRAAIWIIPPDASRPPVLLRSHGIRKQVARAIAAACGVRLSQEMMKRDMPAGIAELENVLGREGQILSQEAGISLYAPILARGKLFALFALGKRLDGNPLAGVELQVLQASLGMVGVALENTGLYNRLLEKHRQLRSANENLEELARLKSEFLRNVNHELRTPLTIIIAYVNFLLEPENLDQDQQLEFLSTINSESMKLKSLLEKLLDFSQMSEENIVLHSEVAEVHTLLDEFHRNRLPGVAESLHEFNYTATDTTISARYDPQQTRKILDVLVDNAVKFTPEGSRLNLRLDSEQDDRGSWARVDLSDDGPGISPERLPSIFDAFRQGDGSSTRAVGGMGMGLALAKTLAEKMGGRLEIESELGAGTTVTLYLPQG